MGGMNILLNRILCPKLENIGQRMLLANHSLIRKKRNDFSTESAADNDKNMSKAMKVYLARAKEHEIFMKERNIEFQLGKRHLANMMGEDPETFTQQDIDNAVEYLFPSGLFEKKARPILKPPEEIFPQRKAAEFDKTGRPFHYLFYTGRPNFYGLLHVIVDNIQELNKFEDVMIRKGNQIDPNLKLDLSGFQWSDKQSLEAILLETITDKEYESFLSAMEALCKLPYSYRSKDFVMKYMRPLMSQSNSTEAPKPSYDEDGRAFITVYDCARKTARGTVTIRSPGTGKISINGKDITYFKDVQSREQISREDLEVWCRGMDKEENVFFEMSDEDIIREVSNNTTNDQEDNDDVIATAPQVTDQDAVNAFELGLQ
ncbi:hypothetical protein WA026_018940 [Henosepilachna vigintioctopunctata]|uniref:28S ribosomal protein S9, mitochondrial n=1 Tax=Henosepilachna vigintioctopunctata TaxID=420089 RepID=A0AAW1UGE7_9CUCU